MLIFKVDFEKAFGSVSWKYLVFVLLSLGFGSKWRSWIKACLKYSRASVLINGSPTSEFSIKRGLREEGHDEEEEEDELYREYEFGHLYGEEFSTFKSKLFHNMDNLEKLLNKELLHEKDSKSTLSVTKVQYDKFLHSEVLKQSNYDECKVQEVKALDANLRNTNSSGIDTNKRNANRSENDCNKTWNDESLGKESNTFGKESNTSGNKRSRPGNEYSERRNFRNDTYIRSSYDTEPIAEIPNNADYNVFTVEKQHTEQAEFNNDTYVMEKNDSNVTSNSSDISHNVRKVDQLVAKHENECVLLASSIEKLKLDIKANKEIHEDLKKVNTSFVKSFSFEK
nr:reverse transcriptase domain, reverse transcriptase zinc-binding domain protein [Tanacetum cinerariifolium]